MGNLIDCGSMVTHLVEMDSTFVRDRIPLFVGRFRPEEHDVEHEARMWLR